MEPFVVRLYTLNSLKHLKPEIKSNIVCILLDWQVSFDNQLFHKNILISDKTKTK